MIGGNVLSPDVCFYGMKRWRKLRKPDAPITETAPDLAIEIVSKANTPRELARKQVEYFASGCRLVWEFDPRKRIVRVYLSPDEFATLTESDTLDGGDVLPGFELILAELFHDTTERS